MSEASGSVASGTEAPVIYWNHGDFSPETWTIYPHLLKAAAQLALRRYMLNLSHSEVAQATGLHMSAVRKAHALNMHSYPFVREAQERIAAYYRTLEVERGYWRV